ncbi:MAG: low molecular weight phosphatase family protein [Acidobacteriota bacterium]
MSHVLFLCTGNTCRSPIAAGIAKRVFGPSHTILSAGAETGNGGPIAPNAIRAAHCLGVDISGQSTRDMTGLDLASFDLIVVFRPSSAEYVQLPTGVLVEYLDVDDPYGSSIEQYSIAARKIERGVRRLYVRDALRRSCVSPVQASSHLAGIFNRAAKECEMEVATFVADDLKQSVSPKATLGQLAGLIAATAASKPSLASLATTVGEANDVWVAVKHRSDPPAKDLREGLEAIERVFDLLDQTA